MEISPLLLAVWTGVVLAAGLVAGGFFAEAGKDAWKGLRQKYFPLAPKQSLLVANESASPVGDPSTTTLPPPSGSKNIHNEFWAEIRAAIEEAPSMQKNAVAQRYLGCKVDWELQVLHVVESTPGNASVFCYGDSTGVMPHIKFIVPLTQYPELKHLREKSRARLRGTIFEIDQFRIDVKPEAAAFSAPVP